MESYKTNLMLAFTRAAAKPDELSGSDFLEAVLRERPDLKGQMAYFPHQGAEAHTVFIGQEVFKGPKAHRILDFDREHQALSVLATCGLPIPTVTCVGKDSVFYGMTRMPGIILRQAMKTLTEDDKKTLAEDIVDFVIGMARALPQKNRGYACHGDLHDGNILFNPQTRKLAAIVDFGRIAYLQKADIPIYMEFLPALKPYLDAQYDARKAELPDLLPDLPVAQQKQPASKSF